MPETRVKLRHLLEDIRDGYPFPLEEAIVTELVANALDSGASEIRFATDPDAGTLAIVDDGDGMTPRMLSEYHDIAATVKVRGKGIGFAGVGAKLSLLLAAEVYTETQCGDFHGATRWRLRDDRRALWQHTLIEGLVTGAHGTAVRIKLPDANSSLLDRAFVQDLIRAHYYPLLDPDFMEKILRYVYEDGVALFVDGRRLELSEDRPEQRLFFVRRGKRQRPAAVGFLKRVVEDLPREERGLAISTYGKVIKRGWEWLGLSPLNPDRLTGVVEVPELAEILTTNKADFLRDSTSLSRYYRYRKAIQRAIRPVLRGLGELEEERRPGGAGDDASEGRERSLAEEMEGVLEELLGEFPELGLAGFGGRSSVDDGRSGADGSRSSADDGRGPGTASRDRALVHGAGNGAGGAVEGARNGGGQGPSARRGDPISIEFEDRPERAELAWLEDGTVCVNRGHPAYARATQEDAEDYHVALAVAWALSSCLDRGHSPQAFVSRFLWSWAGVEPLD